MSIIDQIKQSWYFSSASSAQTSSLNVLLRQITQNIFSKFKYQENLKCYVILYLFSSFFSQLNFSTTKCLNMSKNKFQKQQILKMNESSQLLRVIIIKKEYCKIPAKVALRNISENPEGYLNWEPNQIISNRIQKVIKSNYIICSF
ncbi:Hypothetical_protein [Hexamita inflata]|uniref:Hypothetical_protein n=1 Tax=Hexamita inflata TaxID=28002 RepID=A0AA86PV92_9EUKA|nr:Hypothetical protein HINF_LOCUS33268 [Hexamita inflata]